MLDRRLLKASDYVIGEKVLDVGSDHAYLPIYLVQNHIVNTAIASEVIEGPLKNSQINVKKLNLESEIDVRLGSGLSVLNDEHIDTVTLCGMGGPLIASIIEEGYGYLINKPRFVISSNIYGEVVRKKLQNYGYKLYHEEIVKENNKYYELMIFDEGEANYTDLELSFGPINLQTRSEEFIEKLKREESHLQSIKKQIKQHNSKNVKLKEISSQLKLINEVLNFEY